MNDDKLELSYSDFLREVYSGRINLIREFERRFGKEKVYTILKEFYGSQSVASCRSMVENLEEPISSIEDFRRLIKNLDSRPFSEKAMVNEHPNSPDGQANRITRHCLWADIFKELDAADIGKVMLCDTDHLTAEVFHPKIRLKRTKTIMDGDDCCDFTYVWKE
jgi:hypothetical protein